MSPQRRLDQEPFAEADTGRPIRGAPRVCGLLQNLVDSLWPQKLDCAHSFLRAYPATPDQTIHVPPYSDHQRTRVATTPQAA